MKTDFHNAFHRHADDADLLLERKRRANADHHYGLAAECALKALLRQQGITSKDGDLDDRNYRHHINKLWDKYQNFMQTRHAYAIPPDNPFQDWDIAQRYAPERDIAEQAVRNHGAAVASLRKIIEKAEYEGVLP